MSNSKVISESERLLKQLDRLQGCLNCNERNACELYNFSIQASRKIIEENNLKDSFLGQLLARSLSWMVAEEAQIMQIIDEKGLMVSYSNGKIESSEEDYEDLYDYDEYDEEGEREEPHPLLDIQFRLRGHIRETIRLLVEMNK